MPELKACHECDLLMQMTALEPGQKLLCPRCGHLLSRPLANAWDKSIALAFSALLLLLAANSFPFLAFKAQGQEQSMTLMQSAIELVALDYQLLAVLLIVFIILAPLLLLFTLLYLLLPLPSGRHWPGALKVARWFYWLKPWSMVEIFLIGVLVSLVKIASLAEVIMGMSFWAYVLFSLLLTATMATIDRHQLWDWLEQTRP